MGAAFAPRSPCPNSTAPFWTPTAWNGFLAGPTSSTLPYKSLPLSLGRLSIPNGLESLRSHYDTRETMMQAQTNAADEYLFASNATQKQRNPHHLLPGHLPMTLARWRIRIAAVAMTMASLSGACQAAPEMTIYTDSLQNGWQSWSWSTVDLASRDTVHTGQNSAKITCAGAFKGFYLHHDAMNGSDYGRLVFWISAGSVANQDLTIAGILGTTPAKTVPVAQFAEGGTLAVNAWKKVSIPVSALGVSTSQEFTGFWIMNGAAGETPFFVDDISLLGAEAGAPASAPGNLPVEIQVDASTGQHPISPLIYGVAFGSPETLRSLNCPLNRMGGNSTTCYNWTINADNRGNDWFFESIGDKSATSGQRGDDFIRDSLASGAQPMMTIPMIGRVAKLGPDRGKLASYSIAKYGPQKAHDQWMPDAGNGISAKDGKPVTGSDPDDASVPADSAFQQSWVRHIVSKWGAAEKGGLRYYILDNEPSLWQGTHQDMHPVGPKMEEIRDKIIDYAARIKEVDPGAVIVAPEEWGWNGYLYSGYDQQYGSQHGWNTHPDRATHGDREYLPWLLDELRRHDAAAGKRSLDVFTVHCYPQGGEGGDDVSPAIQGRRNRSTRSLWDPGYTDESWIHSAVQLIPRLKGWVQHYYPGLRIGITEYNWGAENHVNGATAQADILGIFGREGLDLATRWTTPGPNTLTFKAMQIFRNYDGNSSAFGDTSISDTVPNPDTLSSFAAVRKADGALTVMVVNKVGETPIVLGLRSFPSGPKANVWQLTAANKIQHLDDAAVTATNQIALTVPAQSITLLVIPHP